MSLAKRAKVIRRTHLDAELRGRVLLLAGSVQGYLPMAYKMTTIDAGEIVVVRCERRITLGLTAELDSAVHHALRAGARGIVVELSDVVYIDSAGLGSLVSGYTKARNSGGQYVLVGATKKVKDLLQITKLLTIFNVFDTVDAAVAYLRGKQSEVEIE